MTINLINNIMTNKVKSLFFSQYLGQKVWMWDNRGPLTLSDKQLWERTESDRSSLLLRDISQLTDDELLSIARLLKPNEDSTDKQAIIYAAYQMRTKFDSTRPFNIYSCLYQYLTRIGILTNFTYLSETHQPITLTPAEIIAFGWAKLKSNEQ